MSVKTYDAKKVIVVVGGVPIGGFSKDSVVKVVRNNDTFTVTSGAHGDVSRSKSNDKTGELTMTLAQTSLSNDYLSGLAITDEISNTGIVPITVKDLSGTSKFASASGWVKKPADAEFGVEVKDREWVLSLAKVDFFNGGNF